MASSSGYFFVLSIMAILSQFLSAPTSALTNREYIDANCQRVKNKTFCVDTLTTYPPTVSATGLVQTSKHRSICSNRLINFCFLGFMPTLI